MARELGSSISFPSLRDASKHRNMHGISVSDTLAAGLALAPWDVLASGRYRTDAEDKVRRESGETPRTHTQDGKSERDEDEHKISAALEKVAGELGAKSIQAGVSVTSILLYTMGIDGLMVVWQWQLRTTCRRRLMFSRSSAGGRSRT